MKRNSLILVAFLVFTGAVTSITSSSISDNANNKKIKQLEEKKKRERLTLEEEAELTKAKGRQKVVVPGVATLYPTASSAEELNEALATHTIIIAETTQKKSHVHKVGRESPSESIKSWNKFRIIEVLHQAPPAPSFAVREIPQELLPVGSDELLVPTEGGAVLIDGVEVVQRDEDVPAFKLDGKYLLLLSFNPSTRVGELALGPQSIIALNGDETPADNQDDNLLQHALKRFHGGSVRQLKQNVNASSRNN